MNLVLKIQNFACKFAGAGALLLATPADVYAASGDIPFTGGPGIGSEICIVEVINAGTLAPRLNFRRLSSKEAGGSAGMAIVTSRKFGAGSGAGARFRVSLDEPTSFDSAPVGGNDNVVFRTRFSGTSISNGRNFGERRGTRSVGLPRLGTTITQIDAHLIARKTGGNIFEAGDYSATAVLRCE